VHGAVHGNGYTAAAHYAPLWMGALAGSRALRCRASRLLQRAVVLVHTLAQRCRVCRARAVAPVVYALADCQGDKDAAINLQQQMSAKQRNDQSLDLLPAGR
jgi:hypothetical protein